MSSGTRVVRAARRRELVGLDEDPGPAEVDVAPGMIDVEVAVDDEVDLARVDTDVGERVEDRRAHEPQLADIGRREVLADARVDEHRRLRDGERPTH